MEDARTRNRRKSRKHQRFLLRKEFLQHQRIVNQDEADKDTEPIHSRSQSCLQEGYDACLDKQSVRLDEIQVMLGAMPPVAARSSAHPAASDYDSGLSVSGSSPSSRPSSPEPWLKHGKCVAIDCEMVGTGPGGRTSELARCSVVNYCGDVVYDKYINPLLPITDYRTRWSGITRRHMKKAIPFKKAQKEILNILKDKRVIGHDVRNDFKALKYFHPAEQTRDTSRIALLNQLAGLPTRSRVSLKKLAWHILQKKIQVGDKGHSSVEDATTCMELYKLVEEQVEHALLCGFPESIYINPEVLVAPDNSQYLEDQYWPSDLNEGSEFLDCDSHDK